MIYKKHYIPLESNPDLFTELIHRLGVSKSLAFHDVLSLDDADLLAFVPRPVLALILVYPTPLDYEEQIKKRDNAVEEYDRCGEEAEVMWFKQTINNACGLHGILHAVSNGATRAFVVPESHLYSLVQQLTPLNTVQRSAILENDSELEAAYKAVATRGSSEVPANPEDEVDYHYVCFVKSAKDGHLYELDGDREGPLDRGVFAGDDLLGEDGRRALKRFIQREGARDVGFSLLALSPTS